LAKATNLLDGVQQYSARMHGEITTYNADEMRRIIAAADERILPLIVLAVLPGCVMPKSNGWIGKRLTWRKVLSKLKPTRRKPKREGLCRSKTI